MFRINRNNNLNPKNILAIVCSYFEVTPAYLFLKTRSEDVVKMRFIFFYMCIKHTEITYEDLGDFPKIYGLTTFKHCTVLHAKKKIKEHLEGRNKEIIRIHKDLDSLINKIEPITGLIHHVVNYRNKIKELKEQIKQQSKQVKGVSMLSKYGVLNKQWLTEQEMLLIETYRNLDQERKDKALLQTETSLKIQDNMQHQKLRAS
jgi:hypothetical protein